MVQFGLRTTIVRFGKGGQATTALASALTCIHFATMLKTRGAIVKLNVTTGDKRERTQPYRVHSIPVGYLAGLRPHRVSYGGGFGLAGVGIFSPYAA